jgi:hypothetical protein
MEHCPCPSDRTMREDRTSSLVTVRFKTEDVGTQRTLLSLFSEHMGFPRVTSEDVCLAISISSWIYHPLQPDAWMAYNPFPRLHLAEFLV